MQHEPNLSRVSVSGAANEASNFHSLDMPEAGGREEGTGDNPAEVRGSGVSGYANDLPRALEAVSPMTLIQDHDQLLDDYSNILVHFVDALLESNTDKQIRDLIIHYETYLPCRVLTEIKSALNQRHQIIREVQHSEWRNPNG